jgi:hypothetical protein
MTTCIEPGCKRQPAYPDMNRCREHRVRWTPQPFVPEWRRRALAGHGVAKDMTRSAA